MLDARGDPTSSCLGNPRGMRRSSRRASLAAHEPPRTQARPYRVVRKRTKHVELGAYGAYVAATLATSPAISRRKLSGSITSTLSPQSAELTRRMIELPLRKTGTAILMQVPAAVSPIELVAIRGKEPREERSSDITARGLGFYRVVLDATDDDVTLRMTASRELAPSRAIPVRIIAIRSRGTGQTPVVTSTTTSLPVDGKPIQIRWQNGAFRT